MAACCSCPQKQQEKGKHDLTYLSAGNNELDKKCLIMMVSARVNYLMSALTVKLTIQLIIILTLIQ